MELKSKNNSDDEASCEFAQVPEKSHINNFPYEVLERILRHFSFGEIAKLRLVSKKFNKVCGDILNDEFNRLKTAVQVRYTYVKSQMPRRESSRRKHILCRENDIVEMVHMRLTLLNLTVGKHVERNHCCFFAGEVLDEVNRLLNYVQKTLYLNRAFKVTDELFDLSTMAVEYFKEHIEPSLPEVIYFADLMGNSFANPFKPITCTATDANKVSGNQAETTPSISELNDSLKNTRRIVYRNRMSINTMKTSIKSLYQNIANLESIVHQIKREQNDCKEIDLPKNCLNEILFQLNQCSLMIDSFKSQLTNNQRKNRLPNVKQSEVCNLNSETVHPCKNTCESSNCLHVSHNSIPYNYEDSNSSYASTSQTVSENADNSNDCHNVSQESMVSTCTKTNMYQNKRKESENITENILKKRKA
ncbi:F-box only protein 28 like protein [Argiope bruennichi]|uniref:F-box only protein 28 like protein n=1 Tax=Argiope bruennichi TaxID=94029 RepID=A0A8T0E120_ARGBR|nr:F-box only protein 28 like protein [Argiope bruennichi]